MIIAVCDDERELRGELADKIHRHCPGAAITVFSSGSELLASAGRFDIIFLDIGMDGLDGMQTARELRKNGCRAVIIFVTAFEDRVFDAFDVGAFNFLVKPVSDDRFGEVLKKAIDSCTNADIADKDERYITVKSGRVNTRLTLSEIMYAEVLDRKLTLHTVNGEVEYYGRLSEFENCTDDRFFRTHRAYLINLRYLEKYTSSEVTMENGDKVLLAKQRYSALVKAYMRYIKEGGDARLS